MSVEAGAALPATIEAEASVVEVTAAQFEDIYPLLQKLNSQLPKIIWQRLFEYQWGQEEQNKGLAMVCNGRYVGFLGMIFSQREINGQVQKFCNLTSWYVEEAYRNQSLQLILPVMGMKKHTIINLSPTPTAHAIFRKLGFKTLEKRLMILPHGFDLKIQRYEVELVPLKEISTAEKVLSEADLKIFTDHLPYGAEHLVVHDKASGASCYVVAGKTKKKHLNFGQIQYLSNPEMFWANCRIVTGHLFKTLGTWFTLVDERWDTSDRKAFCLYYNLRSPKLFRSTQVPKEAIDHLYTEFILFNS